MNKLVITSKEDIIYYGYFRDGKAVELYCEKRLSDSLLGNIYVARVEKVAEGIRGAFLELTQDQKAYYNISYSDHPIKFTPKHENELRGGDLILVQVRKDAVKTKLPVVDGNVRIAGKYFVLTLGRKGLSLSKKIRDTEERKRLESITKDYIKDKAPLEYGIVIRTNAAGVNREDLLSELEDLMERCSRLLRKAEIAPGKSLIEKEAPYYIQIGRELRFNELDEILTDDPVILDELRDYYDGKIGEKIHFYEDDYPLYLLYRFEHYYKNALNKMVPLKSGGSIIIEPTEAMVVIDVNSGAVLKGKKQAMTIFETMNQEAAAEIACQLRLRNLSGIILIDFINMKDAASRENVMECLKKECESDRIPLRVIDYTGLGLVEMTRSKVRKTLKEQWDECHKSSHTLSI